MLQKNRKIVFENGTCFEGYGFGSNEEKITEIVFNTSCVGYQEIISDPSYTDQSVVMAYPLIGNYGMADDDYETRVPTIGGLIVRDYNDDPSNFRSTKTLDEVMKEYNIVGISGVDTRKLVRIIRNDGCSKVLITDINTDISKAIEMLKEYNPPKDAVSRVSRKNIEVLTPNEYKYHIVAIDCGMKENIVKSLVNKGCKVTIVPYNTTASKILELNPDGIFLSNGPGDPTDVIPVINTVKELKGKIPMFGICLGHQLISLAYGARTYKLKFGHRGGNHPVKNLETGKIEITSQNHSYAVDIDSISDTNLEVTHINILDNTIEGLECKKDKVFSVQYHPESAPGPEDSKYLFDKFISIIGENKNA